MKIVLAPNSFKECLAAGDVADALAEGIRRVHPEAEIVSIPIADGGDGTVVAMVRAAQGALRVSAVCDPLGRAVSAKWGIVNDGRTAIVGMSEASGLSLLKSHERNPRLTSSRGTGELIKDALGAGVEEIVVGIGGSATNDAGVGMAAALGYRFLNKDGHPTPDGGEHLAAIVKIERDRVDPRIAKTRFRVAADVNNPLYGENGAAHVYGPQKGATPEDVELLDAGLRHLAGIIKRDLGIDVSELPGAGAAGGLGAGLAAFVGASLERGIDLMLETTRFAERIQGADLLITGEGQVDRLTFMGKGPLGVAEIAAKAGVPVVCVTGKIADEARDLLKGSAFREVVDITQAELPCREAMQKALGWLADAGERIARGIKQ